MYHLQCIQNGLTITIKQFEHCQEAKNGRVSSCVEGNRLELSLEAMANNYYKQKTPLTEGMEHERKA